MPREKCAACQRPEAVCLCPWLQTINNRFHLTVLRHKSEEKHALNTVNILEKSLSNITVVDGEVFSPRPNAMLIYPGENAIPLETCDEQTFEDKTIILIDGTWRKTRLILHLNPWLRELPCISLPQVKSKYILRKKSPEGFSTLEAAAYLLGTLEKDDKKFQSLTAAMEQMLQFQVEKMGQETFLKNYEKRLEHR